MTTRAAWLSEAFLPVARGAIGVWLVSWPSLRAERCEALLSADERARAARFAFDRDRCCYAVTRGVLRALVACQLDEDPARLEFASDRFGKPRLAGIWDGVLDFNVSHSGPAAAVALSRAGAVGVDVEHVRRMDDRDLVADRTFAPRESAALRELDIAARDRAFFTCWTRKEAFVKAVGQGLSYPLDRFVVSVDPRAASPLVHVEGDAFETSRWTLRDLPEFDGCVGAIAVRAKPAAIEIHHVRQLVPAERLSVEAERYVS